MAEVIAKPPSFPMERQDPLDPPPGYGDARRRQALTRVQLWDGSTAWLATRYEAIRQVLADSRFSAIPSKPGYPFVSEALASLLLNEKPTFVSMDPPEHSRFRRMFAREFTVKRIEALRPRVQEIVDETLDAMMAKGVPADFVQDFALPIPSLVICELLGVPYQDHAFFQDRARKRMDLSAGPEVPLVAGQDIAEYLDKLVAEKEKSPGDDLLSRLVVDQVQPGHLAREDAIAIGRLILVAGHETTANFIATGLLTFLRHPEQMAQVKQDPALIPAAVEELLRYLALPQFNSARVAIEDVEVDGQLVSAGEGVLAMVNAANRDPAAFDDPDRFDIHRAENHHLTFADGIHQCLGQPLARLELQIVFETLFRRLPSIRLHARFEELTFKYDHRAYGVYALPVAW